MIHHHLCLVYWWPFYILIQSLLTNIFLCSSEDEHPFILPIYIKSIRQTFCRGFVTLHICSVPKFFFFFFDTFNLPSVRLILGSLRFCCPSTHRTSKKNRVCMVQTSTSSTISSLQYSVIVSRCCWMTPSLSLTKGLNGV